MGREWGMERRGMEENEGEKRGTDGEGRENGERHGGKGRERERKRMEGKERGGNGNGRKVYLCNNSLIPISAKNLLVFLDNF